MRKNREIKTSIKRKILKTYMVKSSENQDLLDKIQELGFEV